VLGTGKTLVMFIVPAHLETLRSEAAVDVLRRRFEDRTGWTCEKGLTRQQRIDRLIADQQADDTDLCHLIERELDGIVSLEEAGLEESRANNADLRSDVEAFLPVWQEIMAGTIEGQLG
jgi:hypothetical protein